MVGALTLPAEMHWPPLHALLLLHALMQLRALMLPHVQVRGRGGVGSRVDEAGPYLPQGYETSR